MLSFVALLFSLISFGAYAQTNTLSSPNISGNALFRYQYSNFNTDDLSENRNGIDLQEAEIAFFADVDPYSRLNILLSIHPEYEADPVAGRVEQSWLVEPEELYADTNHLPYTNIKIGKFKAAFGRNNLMHTHTLPFASAPLVSTNLLGAEGLNDPGLSAAFLLPTKWFSELTLQYLRGEGENSAFSSPSPSDGVELAHFKNLVDLTESMTLQLGGSYATGKNSMQGNTNLSGADLTFKWRPLEGGRYHSWILASEYLNRNQEQPTSIDENSDGFFIWTQYQFSQRWSALFRWETLKISGSDPLVNTQALENHRWERNSLAFTFNPTEFSWYRFEYSFMRGPENTNGDCEEHAFFLQANFTIGAHPVHIY